MKQYYNIKTNIFQSSALPFPNILIMLVLFYINKENIKFDNWYEYFYFVIIIILIIHSIITVVREKREVVLEYNDNHILFKDIEVKVSWKEIKKVELVYKTFSSIIRVTTSNKIEFTKKRNLLKRFFSMLRMPKTEHIITIYVDKMEGDYLEIFEDIETTFNKNK
jgi:hypothetical protein